MERRILSESEKEKNSQCQGDQLMVDLSERVQMLIQELAYLGKNKHQP